MNIWIDNSQLATALLKGSGLLLVTALAVQLMRKASAAGQFRVCFVGLCMSLLVTVASAVASLSHFEYGLLQSRAGLRGDSPSLNSVESLTVDPGQRSENLQSFDPLALSRHSGDPAGTAGFAAQERIALNGVSEEASESVSGIAWLPSIVKYWPCIWAVGGLFVFTRLLLHYWRSIRASRQLEKLTDPDLLHMTDSLSRQLHLPSPALCVCSESITPFVVGLWRPWIILPLDSRIWSDERRTFVLLHELAHIKRRDLLTQFLAGLVVAVHWFNPFSWLLFSKMMRQRELACDDFVLLQDQQPVRYAETLLEVAVACRSMNHAHGIAMAGKLDLARRIHCALDSTRVRVPFGKRTLFSVVAASLFLCLAIGTIQLRAGVAEPPDQAVAGGSRHAETRETANTDISAALKSDGAIDEEARSMVVRVLDEHPNRSRESIFGSRGSTTSDTIAVPTCRAVTTTQM